MAFIHHISRRNGRFSFLLPPILSLDFMKASRLIIALVALLIEAGICFIFLPPTTLSKRHSREPNATPRATRSITVLYSATSNARNEILVVSVDGIVLDTAEWRIRTGIQVAIETWPHLNDLLSHSTNDNSTWLVKKMKAISHCMIRRTGYSLTCDYALLARLLLEEQELDQGRSVGKKGKYASRFHPSSTSGEDRVSKGTSRSEVTKNNGSRPLTVGEIAVNWSDGACLSETLMTRYNIDGRSPLPVLQENIEFLQSDVNTLGTMSLVDAHICNELADSPYTIILRVGHESDLQLIQTTLQDTSLAGASVVTTVVEALTSNVCLLVNDEISEMKLFQNILMEATPQSTQFVIDHSWTAISKAKVLFGDNIPRVGGKGKAAFCDEQRLSLNLWKDSCSSISLQNNEEMDPWTNIE